jgi:hypothetical protein
MTLKSETNPPYWNAYMKLCNEMWDKHIEQIKHDKGCIADAHLDYIALLYRYQERHGYAEEDLNVASDLVRNFYHRDIHLHKEVYDTHLNFKFKLNDNKFSIRMIENKPGLVYKVNNNEVCKEEFLKLTEIGKL